MVQELAEADRTSWPTVQTGTALRVEAEFTPGDRHAPVDALLLREPGNRATLQADHRSDVMRALAISDQRGGARMRGASLDHGRMRSMITVKQF